MRIEIAKTFSIAATADIGWGIISDIPSVAACMPGLTVTDKVDDSNYKGTIKIKLGPTSMVFKGAVSIVEKDDQKRTISLTSRGQDTKGSSSAQLNLKGRIDVTGDNSFDLVGDSQIIVTGKVASFGARMMQRVGDQVLDQFGKTFEARVMELAADPPADGKKPAPSAVKAPEEIGGFVFTLKVLWGYIKSFFGRR